MRNIIFLFVALWLVPQLSAADAYSVAQRQEAEEHARRVNARVNALEEALQSYQQEINALKAELRGMREELSRANNRNENAATQESIRNLASSIQEVDRKRMADNAKVVAALEKLGQKLAAPTPSTPTPRQQPRAPSDKDFEYTIRPQDNLHNIVRDLREQGFKTTVEDILKANPNLKPNALVVGKKIIIPAPAAAPLP